jgi:O-antigen/teichoic acid export membrane protein
LAWLFASGLIQITTPITTALFPRLSQMVERGEDADLKALYHRSAQAISVLVAPPAVVLMLFGGDVIRLWTGSAEIAANTAPLLALLAAGTMLNCVMILPFVAQLAHGWTRLSVIYHIAAAIVLIPAVIALARVYGAAGAAAVWLALNAGYVMIVIQLMHRRILAGEKRRWYLVDIAAPLAPALIVAGLWRLVATDSMSAPALLALLIGASLTTALASAAAAPEVRGAIVRRLFAARAA